MAGITRNTHLVIGGDDFCHSLDTQIREHSITCTVPDQSEASVSGQEHIDLLPHSVGSEISIPTLYYSELSKSLAGRREATVFAIWDGYTDEFGSVDAVFEGGQSIIDGVPQTAPSTDVISNSFTARPRAVWHRGVKAYPFELKQGRLSVSVGSITLDDVSEGWLVVTANSGDRSVKVKRGALEQTIAIKGPSIKRVNVGSFSTKTATATSLETTGLTGQAVTSGWLLLGNPYERPSV